PLPQELGPSIPPPAAKNVGPLLDRDTGKVVSQSHFYSTGLIFPPRYLRYEVRATINGQPILFSDDPAISPNMADASNPDLHFQVQGARVSALTGIADPETIR